jgi:hypothetical protein
MSSKAAQELRAMLDAVIQHRSAVVATMTDDQGEIGFISPSRLIGAPLPLWKARLKNAAKDGVIEFLYASIREEGWRAFSEGGLKAMHELFEVACGDRYELEDILDHRWNGIGTDAGGYWAA